MTRRRPKEPVKAPAPSASSIPIPPVTSAESRTAVQIARAEMHFAGPLPPPEYLRQYNELIPGCAEALLEDFRSQTLHRMALEQRVVFSDVRKSEWAQHYGFAAFVITIIASAVVGGLAHQVTVAIALAAMDFTGFGATYIVSLFTRAKERDRKAEKQPVRKKGTSGQGKATGGST